MEKEKSLDQLVKEYLDKGGKIKKLPDGEAQGIFKSGVVGAFMKK